MNGTTDHKIGKLEAYIEDVKKDISEWKEINTCQHNDLKEGIAGLGKSLSELRSDWTLTKGKLIGYGTVAGIVVTAVINVAIRFID